MTEIHRDAMVPRFDAATIEEYFEAGLLFCEEYYSDELARLRGLRYPESATPAAFWSEYIWVVYAGGFSSKVVSRLWDSLISAYTRDTWYDFLRDAERRWNEIRPVIANRNKYAAIRRTANLLLEYIFQDIRPPEEALEGGGWWVEFCEHYLDNPARIAQLPHIGLITCHHLARNLGHDTIKPDLHLTRLARHYSCASPQTMCERLAESYDERLGVVDLVLFHTSVHRGTWDLR
jgi:hypothetical protein